MTARLVLGKHAAVTVVPGTPPSRWRLSDDGRRGARTLAAQWRELDLRQIVSSVEPKARGTAEIVAAELGVAAATAPGLHEHVRDGVPFLGEAEFARAMHRFFAEPAALVLGNETADQAFARFDEAVRAALADRAGADLAIVTHGTVLSLFAARHAGVDAFALWSRLQLPSFVVFAVPDLTLIRVVESVAEVRE